MTDPTPDPTPDPPTPEPRRVSEARVDEIEQSWSSASEDSQKEMLEDLRVVIEDDLDNWEPEYMAKAHDLVDSITAKLPDTAADPDPDSGD